MSKALFCPLISSRKMSLYAEPASSAARSCHRYSTRPADNRCHVTYSDERTSAGLLHATYRIQSHTYTIRHATYAVLLVDAQIPTRKQTNTQTGCGPPGLPERYSARAIAHVPRECAHKSVCA